MSKNGDDGYGCITWLVIFVIAGIIGELCAEYSLSILFGDSAVAKWNDINYLLRMALSAVASKIIIILAIILLLISLGVDTPLITP